MKVLNLYCMMAIRYQIINKLCKSVGNRRYSKGKSKTWSFQGVSYDPLNGYCGQVNRKRCNYQPTKKLKLRCKFDEYNIKKFFLYISLNLPYKNIKIIQSIRFALC